VSPPDTPLDIAADTVERLAARWFARRRSGEMSEAEARELQAWLDADAAHRVAYDAVSRAWVRAGLMRTSPEVLHLRARHRRSFPRTRRLLASRALAASLMVAVLGAGGTFGVRAGLAELRKLPTATYRTALGEQRTITLADGSRVTLNTDSVLRTRRSGTQRLVYLDKGQAFFKVAHDASHPFVVTAAGRTVTALGTAFDVRIDRGAFQVVLVEGRVKVEAPVAAARAEAGAAPEAAKVQATELIAGSQLVAVSERDWRVAKADIPEETAWVTGWLKFDGQPLGDVVAELGRYSNQRIVLLDPELAKAPVSGRFRPENMGAFVRALETYGIARVASQTPNEIQLAAPDKKNSREDMGG
jgi:transmembrane sensor